MDPQENTPQNDNNPATPTSSFGATPTPTPSIPLTPLTPPTEVADPTSESNVAVEPTPAPAEPVTPPASVALGDETVPPQVVTSSFAPAKGNNMTKTIITVAVVLVVLAVVAFAFMSL